MSAALDIVGFGSISIDELLYVDRPLAEGKGRIVETRTDHGGNVATALVAAAVLGARTGYIGWLPEQPDVAGVADSLSRHGVETASAACAPDADPIRSTIIVDSKGERFIAYRDSARQGAPPNLSRAVLERARLLLVDGYAATTLPAVRLAVEAGLTVTGDIEWSTGKATDELVSLCHHLVVPWQFAQRLSRSGDPDTMLKRLWHPDREAVIITQGEAGCWFRSRSDVTGWHQPAFKLPVVDTTGCGDCFHGAYAVALSLGHPIARCVRFAAAAAGIAAGGAGGRGALATDQAVSSLMQAQETVAPQRL